MTKAQKTETSRQEKLDALGAYQKRGRLEAGIKRLADILVDESDRGTVVILGSLIEDHLLGRIGKTFVELNTNQKKNLTRGGGPLSGMDQKITLARALGLIDDDMATMLGALKAMRNACAHSRLDISFLTPELKEVLTLLFEPPLDQMVAKSTDSRFLRFSFVTAIVYMRTIISGQGKEAADKAVENLFTTLATEVERAHAKLRT